MTLTLTETRLGGKHGRPAWTLRDGTRTVAVCRPVAGGARGYMVRGFGVLLLDKQPHPMHRSQGGYAPPAPHLAHVATAREARAFMKRLASPGPPRGRPAWLYRPLGEG